METADLIRFALSLGFVVGLIFAVAWVAKRLKIDERFQGKRSDQSQIKVVDRLMIDPKRRLVLIRRGEKEHLLLLGATQDLVIESYDVEHTHDTSHTNAD